MTEFSSFGKNLNVAVFGASGGIGRAVTRVFDQSDAVKSLYALSRRGIEEPYQKATPLSFDLLDEATIVNAVERIEGEIDIVFVATGMLQLETPTSQGARHAVVKPEKTWKALSSEAGVLSYQINCLGPMLIAKHVLPRLRADRKSAFAAISARVGSISDNRMGGWYSYRAAKAALNQMIKCAAIELARKNDKALCVGLHPGTVDTSLSEPFQSNVGKGKLFTPEKSAHAMLGVLDELAVSNSGKLFAWDGQEISS